MYDNRSIVDHTSLLGYAKTVCSVYEIQPKHTNMVSSARDNLETFVVPEFFLAYNQKECLSIYKVENPRYIIGCIHYLLCNLNLNYALQGNVFKLHLIIIVQAYHHLPQK